jgi:hypothetical protein
MRNRAVVGLLLVLVAVCGCDAFMSLGRPGEGPYPEACAPWGFPDRQCRSIVFQAQERAHVDPARVTRTRLLPFEPKRSLGGGQLALVAFDLDDGTVVEQEVTCVGVSSGPPCNMAASVEVFTGLDHDVPCTGEPPDGCATLRPSPAPAAMKLGVPLEVAALDVPIDHVGEYRIEIGKAVLPDGYLSDRSANLVDTAPEDYWLRYVAILVESDVPGREPAGNVYREPFDGPEPMTVFVVFEVTELFEPSVVQLRNIVVR